MATKKKATKKGEYFQPLEYSLSNLEKWKKSNIGVISKIEKALEEIKPKGIEEAFPIFKEQILYICFRAHQYSKEDCEREENNFDLTKEIKAEIPSVINAIGKIQKFLKKYPSFAGEYITKPLESYQNNLEGFKTGKGWGMAGLIFNDETGETIRNKPPGNPAKLSLWYHLVFHFRNFTIHQRITNPDEACPGPPKELIETYPDLSKELIEAFPSFPKEDVYRIPVEYQSMPPYGEPCYGLVADTHNLIFPEQEDEADLEIVKKTIRDYQQKGVLLTAWELPYH